MASHTVKTQRDSLVILSSNVVSRAISFRTPQRPITAGLVDETCTLAAELLTATRSARTPLEKSEARKMTRLLADSAGKELTFHLADEVFRPPTVKEQARVFRQLIARHGIPIYLKPHQRIMMRVGVLASHIFPDIVMPAITEKSLATPNASFSPAKTIISPATSPHEIT